MGTGGYVAIGVGVLALGVVAYFVVASQKAPTRAAAQPASSGGTVQTIGQVAAGVGALANFGSQALKTYDDTQS